MDGVLFDTTQIVNDLTMESYPGLTEDMCRELFCGNIHEEMGKIILPKKEETEEEWKKRFTHYSDKKTGVAMYAGMEELIKKLHQSGYILAINTSARNSTTLPLLECRGVANLFDFVATKEVAQSKVEKFQIIKDKYKVDEKDMLFVTDTLGDIREADKANVPTVAVTWGTHNESYFKREPHKNLMKVVNSVSELENFINSHH